MKAQAGWGGVWAFGVPRVCSGHPGFQEEAESAPRWLLRGSSLPHPLPATPATWESHFISQIKNPFCAVNNR